VVGIQGEGGGEGQERVRFDVQDVMTMTEHTRELYLRSCCSDEAWQ
jgi:hypothetical protein